MGRDHKKAVATAVTTLFDASRQMFIVRLRSQGIAGAAIAPHRRGNPFGRSFGVLR
jgi:hypothetical protein